jgi:putative ABC transport system substrate-binding protein
VLGALFFALCSSVEAQQPAKITRIGYVSGGIPNNSGQAAFRQGLQDLGYIEGKNILVEYRYVEGKLDRYPSFLAELVQLKVDILVVAAGVSAAKRATKTIPIVMVTTGDPVASGLVDSFARPGGNITGITRLTRELGGKRLELLKEVAPTTSRVGVLWSGGIGGFAVYEAAAPALKLQLQSLEVRGPKPHLKAAFEAAAKGRAHALVTILNPVFNRHRKEVAELAIKNRLPSMYEGSLYVEAGGLISYSSDDTENFKRAAVYVDKILKGAKPADLLVEQASKFELVINLKTAKQIGLTIPPNVLARADKVIR